MDRSTFLQLSILFAFGVVVALLVLAIPEFDLTVKGEDFLFRVDNQTCKQKN